MTARVKYADHAQESPTVAERQLLAVLDRRQSALVLVIAGRGMGKTELLEKLGDLARDRGWCVAGGRGGRLSVKPDMDEKAFRVRLGELLGAAFGQASPPPLPGDSVSTGADSEPRKRPADAPGPSVTLIEQLGSMARREPVLLLVDGYQPGPALEDWLAGRFLRDVSEKSGDAVVVVIAERPDNVRQLSCFAEEIISIGPSDRRILRQHFEWLGRQMTPPMEETELQGYTDAVCARPEILGSLTRVLALAMPKD